MAKSKSPKIIEIAIIGKFTDGKCRQLLLCKQTGKAVLSTIIHMDGKIRALKKTLDGMDIENIKDYAP